jgi:hypothetical protein
MIFLDTLESFIFKYEEFFRSECVFQFNISIQWTLYVFYLQFLFATGADSSFQARYDEDTVLQVFSHFF